MKDIFTLCIATILFGLCLIEKESRKKALESAISNQNAVENTETSSNQLNPESILVKSDEIPDSKAVLEDGVVHDTYPLFIQTTSFHSLVKIK